jgi:beta-N-acetylglucosaminidase
VTPTIDEFFAGQDTDRQHLRGIGPAVMEAARKNAINATYIVAHAILETGWGRSRICREKNNLFGWGAEDSDPYGGAKRFDSREDCIAFVMGRVDALYLQPTGRYFEMSPCLGTKRYGMNVHYASDPTWGSDIAQIGRRLEREA